MERHPRRALTRALSLGVVAGLLAMHVACGQRELDPSAVCDEAVFAVASRTYQCTGDEALAAKVAAMFEDLTCLLDDEVDSGGVGGVSQSHYHCPNALYDAVCGDLEANALDLDWWWGQGQDSRCQDVFAEAWDTLGIRPTTTSGTGGGT